MGNINQLEHLILFLFQHLVADEGDMLSQSIFYDAGKFLAKHIIGLLPRVDHVSDILLFYPCVTALTLDSIDTKFNFI